MAKKSSTKKESGQKAGAPRYFVAEMLSFIVAVGGPQIFTTHAPPTDNVGVVRFIVLTVSAVAWAIALFVCSRLTPRESAQKLNQRIVLFAVILAIAVFIAGVFYVNTWEQFAIRFDGNRVLIGTELTPAGSKYFQENESASALQALSAAGGIATDVWTVESINRKRKELFLGYLTVVFTGVFSVVMLTKSPNLNFAHTSK